MVQGRKGGAGRHAKGRQKATKRKGSQEIEKRQAPQGKANGGYRSQVADTQGVDSSRRDNPYTVGLTMSHKDMEQEKEGSARQGNRQQDDDTKTRAKGRQQEARVQPACS